MGQTDTVLVECGPDISSATMVSETPVIVSFLCKCGDDYHSWTTTAYEAVATFTDKDGHYPENAKLQPETY